MQSGHVELHVPKNTYSISINVFFKCMQSIDKIREIKSQLKGNGMCSTSNPLIHYSFPSLQDTTMINWVKLPYKVSRRYCEHLCLDLWQIIVIFWEDFSVNSCMLVYRWGVKIVINQPRHETPYCMFRWQPFTTASVFQYLQPIICDVPV